MSRMLGMLRRAGIVGTAISGVGVASYVAYTNQVRSVERIEDTPDSFQRTFRDLASKRGLKPFPTWGFYTRNVADAQQSRMQSSGLLRFTRDVFGSNFYSLERILSETKEIAAHVDSEEGECFGYLRCVRRYGPNESLWKYEHADFDFALFFGTYSDTHAIGFIEMKGDVYEDVGSRFLLPLLLESGSQE
ncbi:hypothetical protein BJ741DRAFT_216942 [Chytriomyces cf. hyalinus JEL632]|nr:hypothetical protein BJ741DRAFT_216942 [Chytriomyces cf. hyalinus JEL632]